MKLGRLIQEVNILCVKLQNNCRCRAQANFFEKWYFLFQEYAFICETTTPYFKIKRGSTFSQQVGSIIELVTQTGRGSFKSPFRIIYPSFFLCFSSFFKSGLYMTSRLVFQKKSSKSWGVTTPPPPPQKTLWWIHP